MVETTAVASEECKDALHELLSIRIPPDQLV
jgi:hypothetical protein